MPGLLDTGRRPALRRPQRRAGSAPVRCDISDHLVVGILQVLRALAGGELEPLRIGEVLVLELGGNEVPEVVVTLRRVQRGKLRFDEIHREPLRVIRPRVHPHLDIGVRSTDKGANISFKLLQVHITLDRQVGLAATSQPNDRSEQKDRDFVFELGQRVGASA
jgi:hypothetical protein